MTSNLPPIAAALVQSAICRTRGITAVARPLPTLFYYPGLNSRPIHDPKQFPFSDILKSHQAEILQEYKQLASMEIKSDYKEKNEEYLLHNGQWDWSSYILKGQVQPQFQKLCPVTSKVLASIPRIMDATPFGFAFFSTLKGNATIKAHSGACNLRIRCHFPLLVPSGDCGMRIGNDRVTWSEGEPLVFDDSYDHEVWNNTPEQRVVLLFDTWHPDLHADEIQAITSMFEEAKSKGWLK